LLTRYFRLSNFYELVGNAENNHLPKTKQISLNAKMLCLLRIIFKGKGFWYQSKLNRFTLSSPAYLCCKKWNLLTWTAAKTISVKTFVQREKWARQAMWLQPRALYIQIIKAQIKLLGVVFKW